MKNLRKLLVVCILGASLGACSDSPDAVTAPEDARLNGSIIGSGNSDGSEGTPEVTTQSSDSTTTRNGGILGSGN